MTLTLNKTKIFRLAIFLSMFFGFFLSFNNGNVSAISDKVITFDALNPITDNYLICSDSNETCSDYHYIIVDHDLNLSSSSNFALRMQFISIGVENYTVNPRISSRTIYSLTQGLRYVSITNLVSMGSSIYSDGKKLTITLTETNPATPPPTGSLTIDENGTYDVTQYASVNVDIQNVNEIIEDPISNDFQKVFFEIVKNIIPAFGILLVVWFGIDMFSSLIFGRGR